MKRSACMKVATITGAIILFTAVFGVCADEVSKPPAAGAGAPSQVKSDTAKGAEGGAASREEISVTLKAPLDSPLFSDFPIAVVNDEKITLDAFTKNLVSLHSKLSGEESTGRKKSFLELLNRLISIKLIVQEAKNIELDQLPEVKELLTADFQGQLKTRLFAIYLKDVKADGKEAENIYRETTREVKLQQVEFGVEADAKKFVREVRGGRTFDELAAKAVLDGSAERTRTEDYLKTMTMNPESAKLISTMKIGDVSSVISSPPKFIVFKLVEVRYPDEPDKKAEAQTIAHARAQNRVLEKHKLALFKKFVKQNTKLIKTLDFEAPKPGFNNLLQDKRVLVTIKGEKPITVADVAAALVGKFTHGIERAIKAKKVNEEKTAILDSLMAKKVVIKEALARGLDTSPDFKEKIAETEEMTLFGVFIEKILRPEVKIKEADLKEYFSAHINEYTYPEMVKIQAIVFKKKETAQKSLDKLRKGMDFKWLTANAEDRVDPDSAGVHNFGEEALAITSVPEDAQKALAGVKTGDYRLYEGPGGYYVLYVEDEIPSRRQTLEEAQEQVVPAVYNQKVNQLMQEWTKKLRDAADVKIYVDFGR